VIYAATEKEYDKKAGTMNKNALIYMLEKQRGF
jgi:hypothetical protein